MLSICDGLTYETHHQEALNCITFSKLDLPTLTRWHEFVCTLLDKHPPERRWLMLYDVSPVSSLAINSHMRRLAYDLIQKNQEAKGYTAIVLPASRRPSPIHGFIRLINAPYPAREHRIFLDRSKAMTWLETHLL